MLARVVRRMRVPGLARPFSAAARAGIDPSKLEVQLTSTPKTKLPNEQLQFGRSMTDHILELDWTRSEGWAAPRIVPYGPFQLDPAASVLHYALECFEGMKCYMDDDDRIRLFRPDRNIDRLHRSCQRLEFPSFDKGAFLECLKEFLRVERDWIPRGDGYSLYIRPTAISTHPFLGVGASDSIKLYVIASPAGPYYPEGFKPVTLFADEDNVRAWPGGTGNSKLGCNYAPTIQPQRRAAEQGYSQVLWLFGNEDGGQVTEVGTMNLFVRWINESGEEELVTAPLDDLILPGVTRESVLEVARSWDEFKVTERRFSMGDLARASESGRLLEMFGAGTAVVVSPVKGFAWRGREYRVPLDPDNHDAGAGPVAQRMWDTITGIQYGRIESPWSVIV